MFEVLKQLDPPASAANSTVTTSKEYPGGSAQVAAGEKTSSLPAANRTHRGSEVPPRVSFAKTMKDGSK
jgi:hypothetical protein